MKISSALIAVTAAVALVTDAGHASAESPAEFYKDKTIDLMVGGAAGGANGMYARLLARHMTRHIAGNPTIVVKDMSGAGSLRLVQFLFNQAPKDGTTFGAIFKGALIEPLVGTSGIKFDTMKLGFIGSVNTEPTVCVAWHTSKVKKFEDLWKTEMIAGGSGATSGILQNATVVRNLLDVKIKIIAGYTGTSSALLAMERGETSGMCGIAYSSLLSQRPDWITGNKIRFLTQIGNKPDPQLQKINVPEIWQFVKDADKRKAMQLIFNPPDRPYVLPPGVPVDRVKTLQDAFMKTVQDAEFLADADKLKLGISPTSGPEMQELLADLYTSEPRVVEIAKAALSPDGSISCKVIADPKYCLPK